MVSGNVIPGCPNAGNPFHECTVICSEKIISGDVVHKKEKTLFGMKIVYDWDQSCCHQEESLKHVFVLCQVLVRKLQAETLLQVLLIVEADHLWPAISPRRRLIQRVHLQMISTMVTS